MSGYESFHFLSIDESRTIWYPLGLTLGAAFAIAILTPQARRVAIRTARLFWALTTVIGFAIFFLGNQLGLGPLAWLADLGLSVLLGLIIRLLASRLGPTLPKPLSLRFAAESLGSDWIEVRMLQSRMLLVMSFIMGAAFILWNWPGPIQLLVVGSILSVAEFRRLRQMWKVLHSGS